MLIVSFSLLPHLWLWITASACLAISYQSYIYIPSYHKSNSLQGRLFFKQRCSQKFCKMHKKTPVPRPEACNFKRLLHRFFPVKFGQFLRALSTFFYRTPLQPGQLLLALLPFDPTLHMSLHYLLPINVYLCYSTVVLLYHNIYSQINFKWKKIHNTIKLRYLAS